MVVLKEAKAQSRAAARRYQAKARKRLDNLPPGALQLLEFFQRGDDALALPEGEMSKPAAPSSARPSLAKPPASSPKRRSRRSVHWGSPREGAASPGSAEESASERDGRGSPGTDGGGMSSAFGEFRGRLAFSQAAARAQGDHLSSFAFTLARLASDLNMDFHEVQTLKDVFDSVDDGDGELEFPEFEQAVLMICRQLGNAVPEERLKKVAELWHDGDEDGDGKIDFPEFVRWFSSNGFNESLLLSNEQLKLREIARDMGLSSEYVEGIRMKFAEFVDGTGEVDFDAFKRILHKAMRLPADAGLPESRLRHFWHELDMDGSGRASFREFLIWWTKYFNQGQNPSIDFFLGFYRGIRSLHTAKLDPPPYRSSAASNMSMAHRELENLIPYRIGSEQL